MDIAEVLKRAKPPERTVDVCLDADLAAEHDELNRQLMQAQQRTTVRGKGAKGEAEALAKRIRDVEEQMQSSVVTFRMRGLSAYKRQQWLDDHPGREGKNEVFNPLTAVAPLIAACCVDPAMSEDDAKTLVESLGTGQTDALFSAALEATNGQGAVPFSVAASLTLREPEQKPS